MHLQFHSVDGQTIIRNDRFGGAAVYESLNEVLTPINSFSRCLFKVKPLNNTESVVVLFLIQSHHHNNIDSFTLSEFQIELNDFDVGDILLFVYLFILCLNSRFKNDYCAKCFAPNGCCVR